MDNTLQRRMRAFVDESVRVVDSNPIEIADYLYTLYAQHDRLDKLWHIGQRLFDRLAGPTFPEDW